MLRVLCPLGTEAIERKNEYADLGPNFRVRVEDAITWNENNVTFATVMWAFGAGTRKGFESGPTMAELGERVLRESLPHASVIKNTDDAEAFGSLREFEWIVRAVQELYPGQHVEYVVFTQRRHMWRKKMLCRLFFRKENIRYEVSRQTREVPWIHELRGYAAIIATLIFGRTVVGRIRRSVKLSVDRG